MKTTSFLRTTLRIATIASVASLAACGDNGLTAPASPATSAREVTSGGGAAAARSDISLTRPAGAPFANAKGKARFSTKAGERELQIEAENIPAGTVVTIKVGGSVVGTATATALRAVRLNLNSALGQAVPASVAGSAVVLTTAAGAVIVSGSF
jgi:hypothetical protein